MPCKVGLPRLGRFGDTIRLGRNGAAAQMGRSGDTMVCGLATTCTLCRTVPLGTLCDTMRWCAWPIVVYIGPSYRRRVASAVLSVFDAHPEDGLYTGGVRQGCWRSDQQLV